MSSKSITHLPLLYNPFLNCIFNNPHYGKQPFKSLLEELAKNHTAYTILVPPAAVLHECFDPSSTTKVPLRSLCYSNEDFIRSHVMITSSSHSSTVSPISKVQSVVYNTTNGKQILIKNGKIFTGKGFKKSVMLNIVSLSYFDSFCDYFPKGSKFMLIYIEDSLFGSVGEKIPRRIESPSIASQKSVPPAKVPVNDSITFEKLLRRFPLLSNAVSDKFYRLFHHNNHQFRLLRTNTRKKLRHIKVEFQSILDEAYKIISDSISPDNPNNEQIYGIISQILASFPGLDLNRLVHEYVELNLYDKLWSQLIFQFNCANDEEYDVEAVKLLTTEKYKQLSCLALNQLEIPIKKPWEVNELQLRVSNAIDEFSKLSDSSIVNSNLKTKIILKTVEILTGGSGLIVDADTLIGLLIMVIIHSKVENIEAHLYYVKNFNSVDFANDGHFNYILSNFDGVLFHLSSSSRDLIEHSQQNFDFWSSIQSDPDKLRELLDDVQQEFPQDLPCNHYFYSKNINGESCLMFAIKSGNFEVFDLVLNTNPNWLSIEDILFDKNTFTNQNLLMIALSQEYDEISNDLVSLITNNATIEEQVAYFNSTDVSGRSVGHYLFHNYHLIDVIGHLIDWELKDLNSHTPLFSMCRCYDHNEYSKLIEVAFQVCKEGDWKQHFQKSKRHARTKEGEKTIDWNKHIDKMNNSLLHIILKDLDKTRLLLDRQNLININSLNLKSMTPLTLYIKYNRLENLQDLLKDDRLDFMFEDPKNAYNVFDYLGFSAMKSMNSAVFEQIEKLLYAHFIDKFQPAGPESKLTALNAKYDSNRKDWVVFFRNTEGFSNYKSLSVIKQILYITKLEHPLSTFPEEEVFWVNYGLKNSTTLFFQKLRINRLIEQLNILFVYMNLQSGIDQEGFFKRFLIQDGSQATPRGSPSPSNSTQSTLQMIKEVNRVQELKRPENVTLSFGQVQEMEVFLNYSKNELRQYTQQIARFNKLLSVGDYKYADIRAVYDTGLTKIFNDVVTLGRNLNQFSIPIVEYRKNDVGFDVLRSFTIWLELGVAGLIRNTNKILEKVKTWKEIYAGIRELNEELRVYENGISSANGESQNQNQNHTANQNGSPEGISRRNTFSMNQVPENDTEDVGSNFFNLGGMIENRKSKYKRLLMVKSDKIKAIMQLNSDIKMHHETIAGEISSFLKFKSLFMRFSLKQFTVHEVRRLRQRQLELASLLYDIQR